MAERYFVGVGVGAYSRGHAELARAVPDVDDFHRLLDDDFTGELMGNPTKAQISEYLDRLAEGLAGVGSLVLLWSGHAIRSPAGGLRLLAVDSASDLSAGISPLDVIAPCAVSGAGQLLFIIDACFAGQAVGSATELGAALLQAVPPPDARHVWVGMLASCSPLETARDGVFGQRLRSLLTGGPRDPVRRVTWSKQTAFISGEQLRCRVAGGMGGRAVTTVPARWRAGGHVPESAFRPGRARMGGGASTAGCAGRRGPG